MEYKASLQKITSDINIGNEELKKLNDKKQQMEDYVAKLFMNKQVIEKETNDLEDMYDQLIKYVYRKILLNNVVFNVMDINAV